MNFEESFNKIEKDKQQLEINNNKNSTIFLIFIRSSKNSN